MEFQTPTCCLEYSGLLEGEPWAASWLVTLSKTLPNWGFMSPPVKGKWVRLKIS